MGGHDNARWDQRQRRHGNPEIGVSSGTTHDYRPDRVGRRRHRRGILQNRHRNPGSCRFEFILSINRILGGTVVVTTDGALGTGGVQDDFGGAFLSGAGAYLPSMLQFKPTTGDLNYTSIEGTTLVAGTQFIGHGIIESVPAPAEQETILFRPASAGKFRAFLLPRIPISSNPAQSTWSVERSLWEAISQETRPWGSPRVP